MPVSEQFTELQTWSSFTRRSGLSVSLLIFSPWAFLESSHSLVDRCILSVPGIAFGWIHSHLDASYLDVQKLFSIFYMFVLWQPFCWVIDWDGVLSTGYK